jgi:hypothetical protein
MAIEEVDMRDRETWSNVARTWYNIAADKSPNIGRIQHHIAVLARPNIVQQLFYYSKALISIVPFPNARDSIMLLFTPLLDRDDPVYLERYSLVESGLVTAFGIMFIRGSIDDYYSFIEDFSRGLREHIPSTKEKWKTQGPEVAASLIAGVLDFGTTTNPVWDMYQDHMADVKKRRSSPEPAEQWQIDAEDALIRARLQKEFWSDIGRKAPTIPRAPSLATVGSSGKFASSEQVMVFALLIFRQSTVENAHRIGDKNVVPYMGYMLSFIWSLSFAGHALVYMESYIPWTSLVMFLNTVTRSGVSDDRVDSESFPESLSGTGRQLPEDFPARGSIWSQHLFPYDFFRTNVADEDERTLELPSHAVSRCERCLWLGARIASLGRYIKYDNSTKIFSATQYAAKLEKGGQGDSKVLAPQDSHTSAPTEPPNNADESADIDMFDAQSWSVVSAQNGEM